MKKVYSKPLLEIEAYTLDASIAANCAFKINNGPEAPGHTGCDDFVDIFGTLNVQPSYGLMSKPKNITFYLDTNCDCYTTGGDYGYWTS